MPRVCPALAANTTPEAHGRYKHASRVAWTPSDADEGDLDAPIANGQTNAWDAPVDEGEPDGRAGDGTMSPGVNSSRACGSRRSRPEPDAPKPDARTPCLAVA
jgi:hypothetical protein